MAPESWKNVETEKNSGVVESKYIRTPPYFNQKIQKIWKNGKKYIKYIKNIKIKNTRFPSLIHLNPTEWKTSILDKFHMKLI